MQKPPPYLPRVRPGIDLELQRDLRGAYERVNKMALDMQAELDNIRKLLGNADFNAIRSELSAGGSAPLNVQGLLGVLAQPQIAGATVVTVLPGPFDPISQDGALVSLGGQLYVYDEPSQTWVASTGSVSSVDADGGTTGYDFTGGPITTAGTLTMTVANAATARSAIDAASIGTANSFTGSQTYNSYTVSPHDTLTDAGTIATDASLGNRFRVTLGGNRTLGVPTNPHDDQQIVYEIIQDGTGNRTLTLTTGAGGFIFGTDIPSITLSTAANATDFLTVVYNSTADRWRVVGFIKGF